MSGGDSLHRTGPLALGGEGATKLRFLTILSAAAGATHWVFPLQLLKSPYCPLWSVFCTPCLQNFVSAKILLMVQVFCLKISWESELGARASGLSFHLLGPHLLLPSLSLFYSWRNQDSGDFLNHTIVTERDEIWIWTYLKTKPILWAIMLNLLLNGDIACFLYWGINQICWDMWQD